MAGEKNFSGNGLLEWLNTPQGMGLLSGVATYAASARRGTPVNSIGRGLAGGLMGYGQAKDAIAQEQENQILRQYRQSQLDKIRAEIEREQATKSWYSGLPGMIKQAKTQVTPFEADNPFGEDLGNLATVQPGNPQALQEYLMRPESPHANKLVEQQLLPKREYKVVDGSLVEVGAGAPRTVFTAPPKQPTAIQEYQFAREQGYAGSFDQWKKSNARAGATNVNVEGARVFNEAEKKLGAGMGDYAIELRKNADSAYRVADEVNYVVDSLTGYGGGPLTSAKAYVGKFVPDSEWGKLASVGELATTIQAKLAPTMRVAGSGATSDFEMKMWMKAVPTLTTTENGRELIRKYTNRVAERAAARADIEAQLIDERGRVDYAEVARRMKAKFGDKFIDPADAAAIGGEQPRDRSYAPRRATDKAPASVDPKVWQHMTPEERKLWQN